MPQRRSKTIKDDDFAQFFLSTDNLQFKCMLLLMREGRLRVGEVIGLWLQDLEFHRNGLWIRRRHGTTQPGACQEPSRRGGTICRSLAGDEVQSTMTYIHLETKTWQGSGNTFRRLVGMTHMTEEELALLRNLTKAQWRFWTLLQGAITRALHGASILGNTASTFQPTIGRLTC